MAGNMISGKEKKVLAACGPVSPRFSELWFSHL